jgi:hypothetical protein
VEQAALDCDTVFFGAIFMGAGVIMLLRNAYLGDHHARDRRDNSPA